MLRSQPPSVWFSVLTTHSSNLLTQQPLLVYYYRNFLRGEVIAFADYERYNGDKLKLLIDGKLKTETKKYIVNDGDIIEYFAHAKT